MQLGLVSMISFAAIVFLVLCILKGAPALPDCTAASYPASGYDASKSAFGPLQLENAPDGRETQNVIPT